MPNITVLVTFYSRGGSTETLAHAAAVGARQARALKRQRRLPRKSPDPVVRFVLWWRRPARGLQTEKLKARSE